MRQLEAFVAVASELHFGRAAQRLGLATPTLSELVRRLERELGTPLFIRTTRRVVLTSAGAELLGRATEILDEVAAAAAAVRRVADGDAGTVRLGVTPPAAQVLAPHLISLFAAKAPRVTVDLRQLWLPGLSDAVAAGVVDVALTCGPLPDRGALATEIIGAEELLVGLRPGHRLAGRQSVSLLELADDVLGIAPAALFPAWSMSERRALESAGVDPPTVELTGSDLSASRWIEQDGVDWIMLISSLTAGHAATAVRPVRPAELVPFVLQWNPRLAPTAAVARFVRAAVTAELPRGWHSRARASKR